MLLFPRHFFPLPCGWGKRRYENIEPFKRFRRRSSRLFRKRLLPAAFGTRENGKRNSEGTVSNLTFVSFAGSEFYGQRLLYICLSASLTHSDSTVKRDLTRFLISSSGTRFSSASRTYSRPFSPASWYSRYSDIWPTRCTCLLTKWFRAAQD